MAVAYADNKVYVGGAQHITQVLNAATNQRIGFNTTGLSCDQFNFRVCGSFVAGGDTQVLEGLEKEVSSPRIEITVQ